MELIDAVVTVEWVNPSTGQKELSTFERKMFTHDVQWVAQQYAEVNNGKCIIVQGVIKLAEFSVENE